jgi:DNA-binding GntR family transcriptional regulator
MLPGLSDRTQLVLELNEPPSAAIDRPAAIRGLEGHRRVFEALRAGKPDVAAQELHRELTRGKERLVKQMMIRESAIQNEQMEETLRRNQ